MPINAPNSANSALNSPFSAHGLVNSALLLPNSALRSPGAREHLA